MSGKKDQDSLFLLEVLVNRVKFQKSPCFGDKEFRTCVLVECGAVQTIEINDDDEAIRDGSPFSKTFNTGKSCLFSMKESDIRNAMNSFPVNVTVYKALPCGCLPTKIVMGTAAIDMTKEFIQARNKYLEDPNVVSHQALKDCFRLTGPDNTEQGTIDMFLRISCFGSLIVTKFQGAGGTLSIGADNNIHDRSCNPPREYQTAQQPCACGATRGHYGGGGGYGGQPCAAARGPGVCPSGQNPYHYSPCEEPDDPCYCTGPKQPPAQQMSCRNTDPYCLHLPKGRSKAYEEIGTNLAGNELKIKVPAHSAIIKKISQTHCSLQQPDPKGKGNNAGPCEPPCGKNQISLALPSEPTCCYGAQLADTQFTCTTEGCVMTSKHGQLASARGDTKSQEPGNKDTFVLKVAKTAIQGDRKCKLELELTAPKAGDKKPNVEKVSRRVQNNMDCDCCNKIRKPKMRRHR